MAQVEGELKAVKLRLRDEQSLRLVTPEDGAALHPCTVLPLVCIQ
eukprot:SAG31_NODE_1522_length_8012_cov_6.903336_6_plen_45_part_00